jgi:hypothetical protein
LSLSFGGARASEAEYLTSLDGNWSGRGLVRLRTSFPPIAVTCKFTSNGTATSLSLAGKCTGLAMFSQAIRATIRANGTSYTGSYVGPRTGPAGLSGKRSGDALNLRIRWAKDVNGDRSALLRIEKSGKNGMRLTTVDTNPISGKSVVTSQIDLRR